MLTQIENVVGPKKSINDLKRLQARIYAGSYRHDDAFLWETGPVLLEYNNTGVYDVRRNSNESSRFLVQQRNRSMRSINEGTGHLY